ncbi:hypothetical protein ACLMAL_26330 [Nocardia sp. CWNU-33]|uniref:hypothetical protein n=1 Tax=Nocardia sp. CWNU-33 TaxID=3392117 RepID=UPI00398EF2B9
MDAPESWTSKDRRRAARDADRARAASRDHHRAVVAATGTPDEDRVPELRAVPSPAATRISAAEIDEIDLDDLDLPDVEPAPAWEPWTGKEN